MIAEVGSGGDDTCRYSGLAFLDYFIISVIILLSEHDLAVKMTEEVATFFKNIKAGLACEHVLFVSRGSDVLQTNQIVATSKITGYQLRAIVLIIIVVS